MLQKCLRGETNMLLLKPFCWRIFASQSQKACWLFSGEISCILGYRGDYHLHFSLKIVWFFVPCLEDDHVIMSMFQLLWWSSSCFICSICPTVSNDHPVSINRRSSSLGDSMPRMVFCTLVQIRLTEWRKDFCRGQSGGFTTFFFPPTSRFFPSPWTCACKILGGWWSVSTHRIHGNCIFTCIYLTLDGELV